MVTGLAPGGAYSYTVAFDPGAHPQTNAPCTFTTAAFTRPSLAITGPGAPVQEPAPGAIATATFTVALSAPSAEVVTVAYRSVDGSARAPTVTTARWRAS